jgi:2-oxoisovalerate dehydrogenase E1 component alpha subunit
MLGEWDDERHAALLEEASAEVRAAQREAERKGTLTSASIDFPQDVRTMFTDVFEEMPWHLKEQQQAMVDELEAKRRWPS